MYTIRGPTKDPVGNYLYLDSSVKNKSLISHEILVVMGRIELPTSGL